MRDPDSKGKSRPTSLDATSQALRRWFHWDSDVGRSAHMPKLWRGKPRRQQILRFVRKASARAGEDAPWSARKMVTVVFADLADSTALGERLDTETLGQVMRSTSSA